LDGVVAWKLIGWAIAVVGQNLTAENWKGQAMVVAEL